MNGDNRQ